MSFSIGGERSWREIVTLPNILKLFNSKLYGASRSVLLLVFLLVHLLAQFYAIPIGEIINIIDIYLG